MLKFVVLVTFLTIIGLCTKCKGSPTSSNRITRQTSSGCSNAKYGETIPLSEQQTVTFNGAEAKRGASPWHVGIYKHYQQNDETTQRYSCGGTIISENIVISAAQCFTSDTGETKPVSNYHIVAGKLFSNWDAVEDENFAQKRNVSKIEVPESYLGHSSNYAGDIAVIVVSEPFVFTNFVRPACVDWNLEYVDEQLNDGILGQLVVWGIGPDLRMNPLLKENKYPFIESDECYRSLPPKLKKILTNDKYCAGYANANETGVCIAEGGNGMTFTKRQKFYIQGVVSAAFCGKDQYEFYTKLSTHMGWIKKIVDSNKINPAAHN